MWCFATFRGKSLGSIGHSVLKGRPSDLAVRNTSAGVEPDRAVVEPDGSRACNTLTSKDLQSGLLPTTVQTAATSAEG